MPILSLFKTQVRALGKYLEIPEKILNKPPSPDLIPGLTDEEAIGIDYEYLDLILDGLEKEMPPEKIVRETGLPLKDIQYIENLKMRSEHLRKMPDVLSIDRDST